LAADFIYPGPLYAQVPGANLADYLAAADRLLSTISPLTLIFCAHSEDNQRAPVMMRSDVADLAKALEGLKSSGKTPENSVINAKMTLLANNAAFAPWQTR
jgi:glyoxylase-like metal-dependent hydrolase (beta-lactamase superfamily II)